MNIERPNIKRIILLMLFAIIAVLIASATIGREIYENQKVSLLSFAIVNFSGYLFFLIMPVELAFVFYLSSGYDYLTINLVAVSTALVSQAIDYLIGYSVSKKMIYNIIGHKKYELAEYEIRKYGRLTILVFNMLPLSSPVISLAAGMLRYKIKDALFYSFLGLTIKYLVITLLMV